MHSVRLLQRSFLRHGLTRPLTRTATRSMATQGPKSLRVLRYEFVEGMLEKRKPFREEHLRLASQKSGEGKLVLGGALGEAAEGGMLIFKDTPTEEVETFAKADPYVVNGLVTNWSVMPYAVVEGTLKDAL